MFVGGVALHAVAPADQYGAGQEADDAASRHELPLEHQPQFASTLQAVHELCCVHGDEMQEDKPKRQAGQVPTSGPALVPLTHFPLLLHQPHCGAALHVKHDVNRLQAVAQDVLR